MSVFLHHLVTVTPPFQPFLSLWHSSRILCRSRHPLPTSPQPLSFFVCWFGCLLDRLRRSDRTDGLCPSSSDIPITQRKSRMWLGTLFLRHPAETLFWEIRTVNIRYRSHLSLGLSYCFRSLEAPLSFFPFFVSFPVQLVLPGFSLARIPE